jgi:hypothetical protein
LLLHMFVPRCCETYASDKVKELAAKLEDHNKLHLNFLEDDDD